MNKFMSVVKKLGVVVKYATVLIIILKSFQYMWEEIKKEFPNVDQPDEVK